MKRFIGPSRALACVLQPARHLKTSLRWSSALLFLRAVSAFGQITSFPPAASNGGAPPAGSAGSLL